MFEVISTFSIVAHSVVDHTEVGRIVVVDNLHTAIAGGHKQLRRSLA